MGAVHFMFTTGQERYGAAVATTFAQLYLSFLNVTLLVVEVEVWHFFEKSYYQSYSSSDPSRYYSQNNNYSNSCNNYSNSCNNSFGSDWFWKLKCERSLCLSVLLFDDQAKHSLSLSYLFLTIS